MVHVVMLSDGLSNLHTVLRICPKTCNQFQLVLQQRKGAQFKDTEVYSCRYLRI